MNSIYVSGYDTCVNIGDAYASSNSTKYVFKLINDNFIISRPNQTEYTHWDLHFYYIVWIWR